MTEPRRRTVTAVSAPYANYLVPVPGAGPGVCGVCHSAVYDGHSTCYPCDEAARTLKTAVADVTAFVSLAPAGDQFARELFTYKRPGVPDDVRRNRIVGLAAVLWRWLSAHEQCLAQRFGIERFDLITTVPSTSGRHGPHPLETVVAGLVSGTAQRYEPLLCVNRADLPPRAQAADRFRAARRVDGLRVLVIDDTWTTGAHTASRLARH